MKNFLLDAMNEISDEHIAEAATYEPKIKIITWKRAVSVVACLVLVVATAFAMVRISADRPVIDESTDVIRTDASIIVTTTAQATNAPTAATAVTEPSVTDATTENGKTTAAYAPNEVPEKTTAPTTGTIPSDEDNIRLIPTCPAKFYDGWEKWDFTSCYMQIEINNVIYSAFSDDSVPVENEELGSLLYEFRCYDEHYVIEGERYFDVVVYEIKNQDKSKAVAVGRKDGLQGGCFTFFNTEEFDCNTLGELVENLNFSENFTVIDNYSSSYQTHMLYYNRSLLEQFMLKITDGYDDAESDECIIFDEQQAYIIDKEFIKLFTDNKHLKHDGDYASKNYDHSHEKEYLEFEGWLSGYPVKVYLTARGYLFLDFAYVEKCFYVGEEEYTRFLSAVKDIEKTEITPTGEENQTEYDFKSELQKCTTLGDIVSSTGMKSTKHMSDRFTAGFWAYYKKQGNEDVTYSICLKTIEDLTLFIIKNSDKVAEDKISTTGEGLVFDAYFKGVGAEIMLCSDGYLYITCGEVTKGFNVGIDAYNDFMKEFEGSTCVYTPEHPVTMG